MYGDTRKPVAGGESVAACAGKGMPCASPGLCRAEGTEALCFLSGPVFFVTGGYGFRYSVWSGWIIGYKERVLSFNGYASRRSQFAPVIVVLNCFLFAVAFFFKRIFPGEAVWKILLKTGENATGKQKTVFL